MNPTLRFLQVAALTLGAAFGGQVAQAQQQGVAKNEILLGTIQDLSGPLAGYGKQARDGMIMRFDEINGQGGINGRKVRLLVEDNSYDPKKAVLAAQKLVNQDRIFMMVGHIGTAHNNAAMPVQFEKNIVNFFPISGGREMFDEPNSRLKFAYFVPVYEQLAQWLPKVVKEKGITKPCIIYQDDETGLEALRGAENALKSIDRTLHVKTSYKRGATEFSSQVAKMAAGGCDMVVLGTVIRETVGTIAESRKIGFNPVFLGTSNCYSDLIHKLGGDAMDGLYGIVLGPNFPYFDQASDPIRSWSAAYKKKFSEDATVFSIYGYVIADAFVRAAAQAGPDLTTDSFIKAMEATVFPADIFGTPEMKFSSSNRLGVRATRLAQIVNGRWKTLDQ